jgi:hypothetical protein
MKPKSRKIIQIYKTTKFTLNLKLKLSTMKRILQVLIIFMLIGSAQTSFAQCVPDITITTPGIYPDSATGLPDGTVGIPYSEVIQARVLTDTSLNGLPVVITNITVASATGLPPGLSYSCTPSSCVFPGGTNGCMLISGTPTTAGVYPLTVDLDVNGTIFGIPAPPQVTTLDYYSITIVDPTGLPSDLSTLKFELLQNNPNPAASYTDVSFTSPLAGDFIIRMYNMIGKQVYKQNIRGLAGINTTRITLDDTAPGVYMISIENGSSVVTKRMIVSRK